ncbi:MAG TPA: AraC family transcriptional regulator [Cyclobacteriaceae bacterium]|nr:AraC family transcriptional regulator [Cyclobacteriaceae bacterium]
MSAGSDPYPKAYLYRRIVQAKLFIDEHFREKINLDEIAEEASFSRFHFIRLFRVAYGNTPHQYMMSLRMREAEKLMEDAGLRIQDICLEIGFESVGTFTTQFTKIHGMSPRTRQKAILERKRISFKEPLRTIPNCFATQNGWKEKSNF